MTLIDISDFKITSKKEVCVRRTRIRSRNFDPDQEGEGGGKDI